MVAQQTAGTAQDSAESSHKHQAILDQAIRAFAEFGFRGTDVQVIADRAGVGKGTVYRYFGSKEELFWATTLEVFVRLERVILAAMDGAQGALEKLRATGLAYAGFFDAHPDCLEVFVQDRAEFRGAAPDSHHAHHERLLAGFVRLVEDGIAAGEVRPVDARKTILGLGGLLYGIALHSAFTIHNYSLTDQTEFALDTFLKGLRPEESR